VAVLAFAAIATGIVAIGSPPSVVEVAPGESLQRQIDAAPEGATVRLLPGKHAGPIEIRNRVVLEGEPGTVLVAPPGSDAAIHVTADGTRVSQLQVVGGWTGIELDDAAGAVVKDVTVRKSELQGMRIYKASASVENVTISDLRDPHAQGIEVLSAPDVTVRGSEVTGGKIGMVAHLSDVLFENNVAAETTQVGIMIREMSKGAAIDNRVHDVKGAGLYCGDMSRCEFAGNVVRDVAARGTIRSEAGWGLVANYRSTASSSRDVLEGDAGPDLALSNSRITNNSPLDFRAGSAAVWPATVAVVLSVIVLGLVFTACYRFVGTQRDQPTRQAIATTGAVLLATGVAVQSFHMLEHIVQLSRVRFDGVPSRGSLVGSVADTEWVHFGYNTLVLGGLVLLLFLRRRGWNPRGNRVLGDRLVLAAAVLQGYHVVEHTLKVVQHQVTGAKVNPGILGEVFDLVLLHFGLNAAIYLAFVGAAVAYSLRTGLRPAPDRTTRPRGRPGVGPATTG
jgi:nitrous oxidase accessory protein NosD